MLALNTWQFHVSSVAETAEARAGSAYPDGMTDLNDQAVRDILREHRDGGHISRLYATGEITDKTVPALGMLSTELDEQGKNEEAERVWDVMRYVNAAGERPAVDRWVAKL